MPIAFEYPIPKHWQDFERILRDLHPEMNEYGCAGQNQDGIDLVSSDGKTVIQAKKRGLMVKSITIDQLSSWINRAQDFYNKVQFDKLIIATTQKTDKYLQTELLQFTRRYSLPFQIMILFWDAIEEMLIERPELTRKYYLTELYDPILIEKLQSGSLETYIKTTLFNTFINGIDWPNIDRLLKDLPFRIHPGFGHKLNIETLREDLQPLSFWCENILSRVKIQECVINQKFNQKQLLPIEWACSYIEQLRETDIISVLETEMELINFFRKTDSLLKSFDKVPKTEDLVLTSYFYNICRDVLKSLSKLKKYISCNAESLSAYMSLKENMRKRGIQEYIDTNPIKNIHIFGYYGYKVISEGVGTMDDGHSIRLICKPLEKIGIDAWVCLYGVPSPTNIILGKEYIKKLPECNEIRVHLLRSY